MAFQESENLFPVGIINSGLDSEILDFTNVDTSVSHYSILLKDGSDYIISQEDICFYHDSYPHVDIEREFKKMGAWCYSNPSKRKTKRGAKRFINAWLAKSENDYYLGMTSRSYKSGGNPYAQYM